MKTRNKFYLRAIGILILLVSSTSCDNIFGKTKYTEGLTFSLSEDGKSYYVDGYVGESTNVIIPEIYNKLPVTSIGYLAFGECSSLTNIKIPDSITSLEDYAFTGCSSLTSITIPDSVTSIGEGVFLGCSLLENVTIPNSVTSFGNQVFVGCDSIKYNSYDSGLYLGNDTNPYVIFVQTSDKNLTACEINENTKFIDTCALGYCKFLENITIPNGVIGINNEAFYYCSSLTSITIPDSVINIGIRAFDNCPILPYNIYDNGLYLGNDNNPYTVLVKTSDKNVTTCEINENTKIIGPLAFFECHFLPSVTIPDGVVGINKEAFYYCSSLKSIIIPRNVEYIDECAFKTCGSLETIVVDENNKVYDSRNNCNAIIKKSSNTLILGCKNTTIPDGVISIGDYAFCGCAGLENITIPNSIKSIGESAFTGCFSLTSITIPDGVTCISKSTFSHCSSLTNITIPDSVTSIGHYAFYGCTGLENITIPDSVKSIGIEVFDNCPQLQYNTYDNALYLGNNDNPYLVLVKANKQNITTCEINEDTKFILSNAFFGCILLTNISIPDSVSEIGDFAFRRCESLTSITIPNGVEIINAGTFRSCISLTSITIPDSVRSIEDFSFDICDSLSTIYYKGTENQWENISVGDYNDALQNATIIYNYLQEENN